MATQPSLLRILQPGDSSLNDADILIRIERDSDGFVLDANHTDVVQRKFKLDTNCQNPWIPLAKGKGNATGRLETSISLDRTIFKDGDYIVNFHDNRFPSRDIFEMSQIYIYDGKSSTPRPFKDFEIAIRLMQIKIAAHKLPNTLGALLNAMNARQIQIEQKLDALIAKGPK